MTLVMPIPTKRIIYDPDDANADNAGADNFDDNYDADADRYVDAVNNDGCKQQWRKFL